MTNDRDIVTGCTSQSATITSLLLDVRHDRTLGHRTQRKNVSDGKSSLLASIDELTGIHAFIGDESLGVFLVPIGISEDDLAQGSTSTWIMYDILDDSSNVAMSLGVIKRSEFRGRLSKSSMGGWELDC